MSQARPQGDALMSANNGTHMPHAESLLVHFRRIEQLKKAAVNMPTIFLNAAQLSDLELLLTRALFPLQGYMCRQDYQSVLENMRLTDGVFWPLPLVLDVPRELGETLEQGMQVSLCDPEGFMLAVLTLQDVWEPDIQNELRAVFDSSDPLRHPCASEGLSRQGRLYLGGPVEGVHLPQHYDFTHLRRSPSWLHREFSERGWGTIMGFQHETPLHCMHREMLLATAVEAGAKLLVSPLIGPTFATDVSHFTLVRCFEHFMNHLPRNAGILHLTPMRSYGAGPRGAMMQALINRNYGCSHFMVHAHHDDPCGPQAPFYPAHAALEALEKHAQDLDIVPEPVRPRVYAPDFSMFVLPEELKEGVEGVDISHSELCTLLEEGGEVPAWFSYPEIIQELCRATPPRSQQGFTLFLTGLSGAGKSTLAKVLYVKLLELQDRPVTLLDGDIVRRNLSSELTFSKEHRQLNVRRIGFVASEITKNRGIAICAPIAPYESSRREARALVAKYGGFVEIHMSTPLVVCEQRDRKGLYAKARAGVIKGVTGVDDPYEPPQQPELTIDTTDVPPNEGAAMILEHLQQQGYLARP